MIHSRSTQPDQSISLHDQPSPVPMDIQLTATERGKEGIQNSFLEKSSVNYSLALDLELRSGILSGHGRLLDPEPADNIIYSRARLPTKILMIRILLRAIKPNKGKKQRGKEVLCFLHITVTLFGWSNSCDVSKLRLDMCV